MAADIPRDIYRLWKPIPDTRAHRAFRTFDDIIDAMNWMEAGDVLQYIDRDGVSNYRNNRCDWVSRFNADEVEEGAARFEGQIL